MRPASDIRGFWSCATLSFARMAERGLLGSTEGGRREEGWMKRGREREREGMMSKGGKRRWSKEGGRERVKESEEKGGSREGKEGKGRSEGGWVHIYSRFENSNYSHQPSWWPCTYRWFSVCLVSSVLVV